MENLTIKQAYEAIRKQAFEIEGLKDRVSRRNMQIKDLKEGRDLFEKLYTLAEGSISIENMKHYLIEKEKIIHNNR